MRRYSLLGRCLLSVAIAGTLAMPVSASPAVRPNGLVTEGHLSRGRLPNGLRVVIREDPGSGVVAVNAWVHAGGKDETDALCGYSHYLEHLTYRGTERRAPLQNRLEIFNVGGDSSANTYYDRTTYYNVVAKAHFRLAVDGLADLLFHAKLAPEAVEQERQVVSEELRQGLDNPDTVAVNALMAAVFTGHAYARPVIGNFDTLNGLKQDDFRRYYRRMYVPANMVLSINGDVSATEAWRVVQETFGREPAPVGVPEKVAAPGGWSGASRQVLHQEQQRQTVLLGFRAPGFRHPDRPAVDLLIALLGGDTASRLHQRLVMKDAQASYAGASYLPFEQMGLIIVSAAPLDGKPAAPLALGLLDEIGRLQHAPVDRLDLQRLQRQMDRQEVFARADTLTPAYVMGEAELYGDLRYGADYKRWRQSVTPADMQRVARLYLRAENMSAVYSLPKEAAPPTTQEAEALDRAAAALHAAPERPDWQRSWLKDKPSPLPTLDKAGMASRQAIQRWTLPNGLTVILEPRQRHPIVAASLVLPGGSRFDPVGQEGLAYVAGESLMTGTARYDQETIARLISEWGGGLSLSVGREASRMYLQVLRQDAASAMDLMGSLVTAPLLTDDEVGKERDKAASALVRRQDEVSTLVDQAWRQAMYAGSRLAHDLLGTPAGLAQVTGPAARGFVRSHYVPRGAVLAVVGDTSRAELEQWLKLGGWYDWQGGPAPAHPGPAPQARAGRIDVAKVSQQVQIYMGFPGMAVTDPDVPAMRVLLGMLGFQAFVDLIYGKPLAYRVGATGDRFSDSGGDFLYMGTAVTNRDEALAELQGRWERLAAGKVEPDLLHEAQARILGSQALSDQHWLGRASGLAGYEWQGLGYVTYDAQLRAIEKLTPTQLLAVAKRRLRADQLLTVVAGGTGALPSD
jgi:zinc protease